MKAELRLCRVHVTPHYELIFSCTNGAIRRRVTLIAMVKKWIALLITFQTAITRLFYCVVNSLNERCCCKWGRWEKENVGDMAKASYQKTHFHGNSPRSLLTQILENVYICKQMRSWIRRRSSRFNSIRAETKSCHTLGTLFLVRAAQLEVNLDFPPRPRSRRYFCLALLKRCQARWGTSLAGYF